MEKRDKEEKVLERVRERFKSSLESSEFSYREMKEDLEFLNGDQWDASIKNDRDADNRPSLTINKLPTFVDQVVGDQRMQRPSIKVKPVDSGADKDTAEIFQGLIRSIEMQSNAAHAYDTAFDAAVQCGFGAFRIITDYVDHTSFDQEIKIISIDNQFTVYLDPNAKMWDYSDAEFCFVTEKIKRSEFERRWPDAGFSEFDSERDAYAEWVEGDLIRVSEYWEKQYEDATIFLVQVGSNPEPVVFKNKLEFEGLDVDYKIVAERKVRIPKIMWYRVSGADILEGPVEQAGKYFPVVPVWGKRLNIENKKIHRGLVRHAKDPQRLYNYSRSMSAESIALAPRAPYLATPKQMAGFEAIWKVANRKNYTVLPYNPDPQAPPPTRQPVTPASQGIQQETLIADQELHDTTGLQRSSLGKQSNEKSGKAIMARQKEGDVGTYDYTNSLVMGMTHGGKILVDLIPKIYDTERVIRIIGEDGEDSLVPINQRIEEIDRAFDLAAGKYDVVVSTGPSFTTQREETRTSMMEFLQYVPDAGPLVADLIAKNMDWPGAEEFAERLRPPNTNEPSPEEEAMQEILKEAELRTLQAKTEQEELKAEQIDLENEKIAAEIKKIKAETSDIYNGDSENEREQTESK